MKTVTPEAFAPILAQALSEATQNFHNDPEGPMNALVSGLAVFRDLLFDTKAQPSQEAIVPGYMWIRRALLFVMEGDLEKAQSMLESYANEFPMGVFARAVTGEKVINMMTLEVPKRKANAWCRNCRKTTAFLHQGNNLFTCDQCGHETHIKVL